MATDRDKDFPELLVVDFPGGCPMVVDPTKPHLGGNMRGGDGATDYTADLWPWLARVYDLKEKVLLDVGCAEGHSVRAFRAFGVEAIGLEGLWQNARRVGFPTIVHDLTKGPLRIEGVEFVWCCDVLEHVAEEFVENVMETFKCARYVACCHGTEEHAPNGWHHVNNKSVEYWAAKFREAGFELEVGRTKESHEITKGRMYWPDSGRIWKNTKWPRPF